MDAGRWLEKCANGPPMWLCRNGVQVFDKIGRCNVGVSVAGEIIDWVLLSLSRYESLVMWYM
jgi:hypothetical protein